MPHLHPSTLWTLLALTLAGCCCHHNSTPTTQTAQSTYPTIVRLVARHQTITISAGPHGSLYSINTDTGQTLIANATLADLRDHHPDLYRQLAPALASAALEPSAPSGSKLNLPQLIADEAAR
jgi:hypothetical protein